MKTFYKNVLAIGMAITASYAFSQGWPANYGGVMLQGFYWDSYTDTKWTNLESQSDELSTYFDLIWVPNSAKAEGYMGYMPKYWFTNHNSAFGTEAELRKMIKTFASKGTGIIEDVVVNHRDGVSNWYNFPVETWNGQTWSIGLDGICSDDEMAYAEGMPKPTGNPDTGENFDGCRDLDHTNANVQNNVKNYCKFLLEDLGYAGFRLDMVKGYGGQYTKIYNEFSKPKYSVGEYWDGQYDNVAAWIEATGKTSAAFDFPCKYQLNKAFNDGLNMNELAWLENGATPQPAGMIHHYYQQYAVTFVDNHDTYRDGSKFTDDAHVLAANAFILCSPGTPCVFLPHYKANKIKIQTMILARKAAGVTNTSKVTVQKHTNNSYIAVTQGTKGQLALKIGANMDAPEGFNDSEIVLSGNDFCIWLKGATFTPPTPEVTKEEITIYFDNSTSKWATPYIHYWGTTESKWPGVAMTQYEGDIWSFTLPVGTTGLLFNAGDGDPTKTQDMEPAANHIYNTDGDQGLYAGAVPNEPFYIYFDNTQSSWKTPYVHYWGKTESKWPGVAMSHVSGNIWSYQVPGGTTGLIFNAGDGDATKTPDLDAQENHLYTINGDQGVYSGAGIENIATEDVQPIYFNLQGVEVKNPSNGIFIKVTPAKREKIYIK